jgi:hypothetical protein
MMYGAMFRGGFCFIPFFVCETFSRFAAGSVATERNTTNPKWSALNWVNLCYPIIPAVFVR